jgi:hypothetical protein
MSYHIQPKCDHPPVECFGTWKEDSNCATVFDEEWMDGIWADGAESWQEAVDELAEYALRCGTLLIECSAC